jgi:hypothetical protein
MKKEIIAKSDLAGYYLLKFLFASSIFTLISMLSSHINEVDKILQQDKAITDILLIFFLLFLSINYLSMIFKVYRGYVSKDKIIIKNILGDKTILWEDVKSINKGLFWGHPVVKIRLNNHRNYSIYTDATKMSFSEIFNLKNYFRKADFTLMWHIAKSKK